MSARWRTGRKVGRTLYRQLGPEPSDDDPLIGVMDTPGLASRAVDAVNTAIADAMLADLCNALRDYARRLSSAECALLADILDEHGVEIDGINTTDSPETP